MPTQRVKFDAARLADFELTVEVGDILSEDGMTRVRLDGYGRLAVEQLCQKERGRQFSGEMDRESTERLLRQASQLDWERGFPSRKGLPDEAIVQWSLHDRQGETITVRVWLREAEKDSAIAPVLAALRQVVERATDGTLYL